MDGLWDRRETPYHQPDERVVGQIARREDGAHHRYDLDRFVKEGFLEVANTVRQGRVVSFDLSDAIEELNASIVQRSGAFFTQAHVARCVEIPRRFQDLL